MKETFCIAALIPVLLLVVTGEGCGSGEPAVIAEPGSLWHMALVHSDGLAADGLMVESASEMRAASGRLPDPAVRVGWAPEPLETRNGPVEFSVTFSQKIPWPGILSGEREEAGYRVDLAELEYLLSRMHLRTVIAGLWAEMYVARAAAGLYGDELDRLDHISEVAGIRYRTGQTDLSTLLILENRMVLVESRMIGQQLTLESLELELESVVGQPISAFNWPDSLPGVEYFLEGMSIPVDLEDSPRVRLSTAFAGYSNATAAVSRAGLNPDIEIGATWSAVGEPELETGAVAPGHDALMIFTGISIPLGYSSAGHSHRASHLSAEAAALMQHQVMADQTASRERLVRELESLILLHRSYRETVLPNLGAIHDLAMTEWIAGSADVEEVMETLGDMEENMLEEYRIYSSIVHTYAELIELDGRETEKGEFL